MKFNKTVIADIITKASRSKLDCAQKAAALYSAAKTSIGLKRVSDVDRYRLTVCLSEVKRTERMLQEIKKEMKVLLKHLPTAQYLLSIPGVGPLSAVIFLGELRKRKKRRLNRQ
jgi:transposase